MTKGIFISVFGKAGYGYAAWNLAFSIKKFSPDIPITLFCEAKTIERLDPNKQQVFDDVIFIPSQLLQPFDPCKVKINIYDYLPCDINLVLDADSLALKDVTQCFTDFEESGLNYATHIYKTHTIDKGRDFPEMWWAWMDDVWEHYKLPQDAEFPATNSSWQIIKKSVESKKLFDKIKENYANPIPIERLKNKWGGTQPDELYLNIALAQCGFAQYNKIMFFGVQNRSEANWQQEITDEYFFLSIFGGTRTTKQMFIEWYDKLLFKHCREMIPPMAHIFKTNYINADKHMNNPLKLPRSKNGFSVLPMTSQNGSSSVKLLPAIIPLSRTQMVNAKKLISAYSGPKGEQIKPTNFFNCSAIEFKGKKYFAYRMERMPWCTRMKIGLCLLDNDLQPIPETNTLPDIYTNLPPFAQGFHAEDPRLFIHRDELYLSYTDGYQMGQAKINPDTLQSEESFYISKTGLQKIEKNWIFFDYEGKLFCVYNTSPHIIFEMNGDKWVKVFQTPFDNDWKYGTIRGGTSPIRHGEYYISFFHSRMDFTERNRPNGGQYFMGCYMFEAKPPFTPVAISKEPLLAGEKMDDSVPRMWNKLFVVFPNGKIRTENGWMVSFGWNDYGCRFAEVTDAMLEENLIWIKEKELVI